MKPIVFINILTKTFAGMLEDVCDHNMVCAQAILWAQNHTLGGDGCFVCHA